MKFLISNNKIQDTQFSFHNYLNMLKFLPTGVLILASFSLESSLCTQHYMHLSNFHVYLSYKLCEQNTTIVPYSVVMYFIHIINVCIRNIYTNRLFIAD